MADIGPGGGSVAAASGETVTFAPGTFSGDIQVTLSVYDALNVPAPPAGWAIVGHAIDLQPAGVTFNPPAVITFPYTDAQLGGEQAASLAVWVYVNGAWQSLEHTLDPAHHTVSVSVPHFTLYALMIQHGGASHGLPGTGDGSAQARERLLFAWVASIAGAVGVLTLAAGLGRRGGKRFYRLAK